MIIQRKKIWIFILKMSISEIIFYNPAIIKMRFGHIELAFIQKSSCRQKFLKIKNKQIEIVDCHTNCYTSFTEKLNSKKIWMICIPVSKFKISETGNTSEVLLTSGIHVYIFLKFPASEKRDIPTFDSVILSEK